MHPYQIVDYPAWFKCETGFRFRDPDGDVCMFLGKQEGYRKSETLIASIKTEKGCMGEFVTNHLEFVSEVDVVTYKYKEEWFLNDVQCLMKDSPKWLSECKSEEEWQREAAARLAKTKEWDQMSPAERSQFLFEKSSK